MVLRQVKYLNTIVEQGHRAVKRVTKPMLGFKSFHAASHVLVGIELMHIIRKGQSDGRYQRMRNSLSLNNFMYWRGHCAPTH